MTDQFLNWDEIPSPYEALSEVGISPDSSMKQVRDASMDLMEQGLWTPEKRVAWDELRIIERRLWVDFLRYPATIEGIIEALADLCKVDGEPPPPAPNLTQFSQPGPAGSAAGSDESQKIISSNLEFDA